MDSRLRGKHPSERPSHGTNILGGIEKKYSEGMTNRAFAESTPQNAPRIEKKCSGVLKRNTRGE
jgi:hypothetical protein